MRHEAALTGGVLALFGAATAFAAPTAGDAALGGTYESVAVGQIVPSNVDDFCSQAGGFHIYSQRKLPTELSTKTPPVSARRVDEGFVAVLHPAATVANSSDAMWLISAFLMGMKDCVGTSMLRPMRGTTVEGLAVTQDPHGDVRVDFQGSKP